MAKKRMAIPARIHPLRAATANPRAMESEPR
jgi:hypothetical protein